MYVFCTVYFASTYFLSLEGVCVCILLSQEAATLFF